MYKFIFLYHKYQFILTSKMAKTVISFSKFLGLKSHSTQSENTTIFEK